ncbi:PAS domain-containing sensor histidine kinase, partial [Longimicrobium sp.]|uniref:PAS domain-containing sensor histidine kinase n=1 Tax=Longimicrobium sp. TaxID=2029185 RepID=UPI002F91C978
MIAPVPPQQRLPELISRLGALLQEIDDATGGQVDTLVDPASQVSWLLRGAQEALVRQEQEFRALAENSPDLILRVSPGLRVMYANPAALRMRGESLDTLRGTPLYVLTGGEAGTDALQAAIEEVVSTGQPREAEFVFGEGASERVLHARLNPEMGTDGELASVLAVLRDTTSVHAFTRELAAAHKRISGILESVTDAFFSLDAGWRFTYLNSRAEALMQRDRAELLGRSLWEAFPSSVGTRFETEYRRVAAERVPSMFEEFYAPLNTWREVHAYPAEDGGVSVYFRDISERKARERETADLVERLATKRALLEAVLRQLPVGVVIAEAPSGRLLMGNEQVDQIFGHGYQPSASIGEYGEWVGYHLDGSRVQSEEWPLSRALRTGVPAGPDEYHVPRADGTRGTARLSASPVMDAQGAVIAGVVVIADVTEQRAALDALRASDERFRLVNLATNDIIYDWELRAGTVDWNAALGTLGHDRATIPRTAAWWYEQVHPDDTPRVRASMDAFLAGRGLFWAEDYRFRRADGSYARVYDRAHLLRGEDGRPERMIGSMLDVSQRDAADAALHHQALLLDTVEQAVIATDLQGNITYWNRFAEELYGWKRHEVMGRSVVEVTPSEEMMEEAARIMEALSRGESWSGQFPVRRRDGTAFMAQVTDTPICGPTGELVGVVGVSFDITDRRELEEQLRQSQKMDAVGQLAGGVAHDFNNLLTVITGNLEFLRGDLPRELPESHPVWQDVDEVAQAAERARALVRQLLTFSRKQPVRLEPLDLARAVRHAEGLLRRVIGEAAERAASLTRQLLAFSRRQILKPQPVNLASLVSGLLPMLTRLIGEDVELCFTAGAAAAQAEADPGQLEQVLMNLVVNARDAIPAGGGRIMVETREVLVRTGDEGPDAGLAPGRYAVLAVRDSGTGMPEEVRRRVFEPFFTTKEPGKGTGLGLSTVYGIARQSDGHVFVDSEPGKGTEFRVY